MPTKGQKFLTEYIRPHLDRETFGERLKWKDKENEVFQLIWKHKSANGWSEEEVQVFIGWDKKKRRYSPNDKDYFTRSKQRFRAVLNKHCHGKHVTEIINPDKSVKVFCMGDGSTLPRKYRTSSRITNMIPKKELNDISVKSEPDACRLDFDFLPNLVESQQEPSYISTEDTKSSTSEYSSDSYLGTAMDPKMISFETDMLFDAPYDPFFGNFPIPGVPDGNCDDSIVPEDDDLNNAKDVFVEIYVCENNTTQKNEPGDIKVKTELLDNSYPVSALNTEWEMRKGEFWGDDE